MSKTCPDPNCGGTMVLVDAEYDIWECESCGYSSEGEEVDGYWDDVASQEEADEMYNELLSQGIIEGDDDIEPESYEQVFDELDQAMDID